MVPKASSKVKVVAVLRLPKRGPKNGTPFLEPVESVPILKGTKKGSEIRTRFWPRFSRNLAPSPSEFSLSSNSQQNGGKQALGNLRLLAQILS